MLPRFGWVLALVVLPMAGVADAIELQRVMSGLTNPLYLTHARGGSGRLFVVEQDGVIKVLPPGASTPTVFLDITDRVLSGGEQGLLGLAFHPQYPANGRFFVNYTTGGGRGFTAGTTVIAEYARSADPNVASRTERILLTIDRPAGNHNAGMIEFGPDGLLYIGTGDSGGGNDPLNLAQNIGVLQGKILRIDVNGTQPYAIPPDNPFTSRIDARHEIYAVGLRNPFRFSFDRAAGTLVVGDVGQVASEEISIVTRGANMGWRVFEGFRCTMLTPAETARCAEPGFTPPILAYGHEAGRCSVTGGYVYRGQAGTLPPGIYVFADFCSGEIFVPDGAGGAALVLATGLSISSFGEDGSGELYVVGLGTGGTSGTVDRLIGGATETARQAFIRGFYATVLGRTPATTELTPWADFLRSNCNAGGVQTVARAFFGSPEFAARPLTLAGQVTVLYRTLLGRAPDPAGLAAWVDVLRQGRLQLALRGFIPSAEFRALVPDRTNRAAVDAVITRFYTEILGRAPEAAGRIAWVNFVLATGALETGAVGFLASPEFETRTLTPAGYVTILYRAFLGRPPDPAGRAAWEAVLSTTLTSVVESGFLPAAEFNLAALCGG